MADENQGIVFSYSIPNNPELPLASENRIYVSDPPYFGADANSAAFNNSITGTNYSITYSGGPVLCVPDIPEMTPGAAFNNAIPGGIWGKITYDLIGEATVPGSVFRFVNVVMGTYRFVGLILCNQLVVQGGGASNYWDITYICCITTMNYQIIHTLQQLDHLGVGKAAGSQPIYYGCSLVPNGSDGYYAVLYFDQFIGGGPVFPDLHAQPWLFQGRTTTQYSTNMIMRPTYPRNMDFYGQQINGTVVFNLSKFCSDNQITLELLPETSPEVGDPSEPGGYDPYEEGHLDPSSDTIEIPTAPTIGVSNVGFVNVYKTGTSSLQNMGVELFPPLQYSVPPSISSGTVVDALVDSMNSIMTWLGNIPSFFEQITASTLINYIIDCHVIPVTPSGGTSENIKVGYKTLNVTGLRLSNDYVDFDCGDVSIKEYYGNFADYISTCKLYLPFVGFVPAKPEWFFGESLNVTYRFNIIDGSFVAFVRSTGKHVNNNNQGKTIISQYGGNACVHLPITGVTYASMVSGLVGSGAGAIAGAASGNVALAATSALAAAQAHGDIAQSNAYASSAAFLGCRRPFLMIERPVSFYAKNYQHEIGIPSNIYARLGDVSGFNQMTNVHVDGIDRATDQEKEEIRKLLASGVIV